MFPYNGQMADSNLQRKYGNLRVPFNSVNMNCGVSLLWTDGRLKLTDKVWKPLGTF
jgi:hypothetical protein